MTSVLKVDSIQNAAGTAAMTIDSAGRILTPARPVFRAYSSGNWTIAHNTFTIFPANTAVINVGSSYNTSTYKFTAPIAGVYYFYGQWFGSVSSNRGIISIYKNDSQTEDDMGSQALYQGSTANGGVSYGGQNLMQMDVGDTASCHTYQESGGTVTTANQSHLSFWFGYLLG